MNREDARKLVAECWEDATGDGGATDTVDGGMAYFSALVAARLAPEMPRKWEPAPNPYSDGSGGFMGPAVYDPDGKLVGEEPRPSYVPAGAPWEWTTLARGERVAMWVDADPDSGASVDLGPWPWHFMTPNEPSITEERRASFGPTALAAVEAFGRKHGVWS